MPEQPARRKSNIWAFVRVKDAVFRAMLFNSFRVELQNSAVYRSASEDPNTAEVPVGLLLSLGNHLYLRPTQVEGPGSPHGSSLCNFALVTNTDIQFV